MSEANFDIKALREAARRYVNELGFSVIPLIYGEKRPKIRWEEFQHRKPTDIELDKWFSEKANIAVICGAVSGNLVVLDFDDPETYCKFFPKHEQLEKETIVVKTARGIQVYLRTDKPVSSMKFPDIKLDVKGEGGYVVAPPSLHPSGVQYQFVNPDVKQVLFVPDLEKSLLENIEKIFGAKIKRKFWFEREFVGEYKGPHPPCIKVLLRGVEQGIRNETAIRLASYFANFRGWDYNRVLKKLKKWNESNRPPLDEKELEAVVESAFKGKYNYGCDDEILDRACCHSNECLFYKYKIRKAPPEVVEKAWELVKDPAFFFKLGKIFEKGFLIPKTKKKRFVLAEERNKRLLPFLVGHFPLIRIIGEPGTAKDTMARMTLRLLERAFDSEERTHLTPAVLKYSPFIKSADILYIPDTAALEGETGRQLRFMRGDDGGIIAEYTIRDQDTGEFTTKVERLNIKSILTTSNEIQIDRALESGMFTLKTNDSENLTQLVKMEKLKSYAGLHEFVPEDELVIWQEAFRIIFKEKPIEINEILIPYAPALIDLFKKEESGSRRDPDKLCELIQIIAFVRRFQKPEEKWKEADFVDLYIALQISLDALVETMAPLGEKELFYYRIVKEHELVTVAEVAQKTGKAVPTVRKWLNNLADKGYLLKSKDGKRNIYSILKTPEDSIFTDITESNNPISQIKKVLESVRIRYSDTLEKETIDPITGERVKIIVNEKGISCVSVYQVGMKQNTDSSLGDKPEDPVISINIESLGSKSGEFKCPYCPCVFGSERDLKAHLKTHNLGGENRDVEMGEMPVRGKGVILF